MVLIKELRRSTMLKQTSAALLLTTALVASIAGTVSVLAATKFLATTVVGERFRFRIQIVTRIWIFADPRKGQGRPETDGFVFSPALAPGRSGNVLGVLGAGSKTG